MNTNIFRGRVSGPHPGAAQEATQEELPARRAVLRGALAVGCGLWVPIVFSGCDSKQESSPGSTAPGASPAPAMPAAPAAPTASSKAQPANVQYQSQPKGEQKCSLCQHFIAESNTCKLVDGPISPDGWCSLWTKMG